MKQYIPILLAVALAIIIAQVLSKKFFTPGAGPKEQLQTTSSGDPIRDFLDSYTYTGSIGNN